MAQTYTATQTKDLGISEAGARQVLYRFDPPLEGHEHVVVSAVDSCWAHETYLFGADAEGAVRDFLELHGSQRGTTDIDAVVAELVDSGWPTEPTTWS